MAAAEGEESQQAAAVEAEVGSDPAKADADANAGQEEVEVGDEGQDAEDAPAVEEEVVEQQQQEEAPPEPPAVDLDHTESLTEAFLGGWSGVIRLRPAPLQRGEVAEGELPADRLLQVTEGGEVKVAETRDEAMTDAFSVLGKAAVLTDMLYLRTDPISAVMNGSMRTNDMPMLMQFVKAFAFPNTPYVAAGGQASGSQNKYDFPFGGLPGVTWYQMAAREVARRPTLPGDPSEVFQRTLRFLEASFMGLEDGMKGRCDIVLTDVARKVHPDVVKNVLSMSLNIAGAKITITTGPPSSPEAEPALCKIEGPMTVMLPVLQGSVDTTMAYLSGNLVVDEPKAMNDVFNLFGMHDNAFAEYCASEELAGALGGETPEKEDMLLYALHLLGRSFTGCNGEAVAKFTVTDGSAAENGKPASIDVIVHAGPTKMSAWTVLPDGVNAPTVEFVGTKHQLVGLITDQMDPHVLATQGCLSVSMMLPLQNFFSAFKLRFNAVEVMLRDELGISDLRTAIKSKKAEASALINLVLDGFDLMPQFVNEKLPRPATAGAVRLRITFGLGGEAIDDDNGGVDGEGEEETELQDMEDAHQIRRTLVVVPSGSNNSADNESFSAAVIVEEGWSPDAQDIVCTATMDGQTFIDVISAQCLMGEAYTENRVLVDNLSPFIEFSKLFSFSPEKYMRASEVANLLRQKIDSGTLNEKVQPPTAIELENMGETPYVVELDPEDTVEDVQAGQSKRAGWLCARKPPVLPADDAPEVAEQDAEDQGEQADEPAEEDEAAEAVEEDELEAERKREQEATAAKAKQALLKTLLGGAEQRSKDIQDWRESAKEVLRGLSEQEMAVEKEGFLAMKKSSGAWKMRYIIVKNSKLFCYGKGFLDSKIEFHWRTNLSSECSLSPVEELGTDEEASLPKALKRYIHAFQLVEPGRTRYFAAPSEEAAAEWTETMQSSIDQRNAMSVRGLKPVEGTLAQIVAQLTGPEPPELKLIKAFLFTYRAFSSPMEVFSALKERHAAAPEAVISLLEIWLIDHCEDLTSAPDSAELLASLEEFVGQLDGDVAERMSVALSFAKNPTMQGIGRPVSMFQKEMPKMPAKLTFMDTNAEEMARQITMIERQIFLKIQPHELLNQNYNKESNEQLSPNVVAVIDRFNKLIAQISTAIIIPPTVEKRAGVILRMIEICEQLRLLNNFNSLKAFLAALSTAAVERLTHTWAFVPQSAIERLEDLQADLSGEKGHSRYRKVLYASTPPALPFLGVLLTDLSFIDEGNPTYVKGQDKLINFTKQQFIFNVLEDFLHYVEMPYNFDPVVAIQMIMEKMPTVDVDALMEMSQRREPEGASRQDVMSIRLVLYDSDQALMRPLFHQL